MNQLLSPKFPLQWKVVFVTVLTIGIAWAFHSRVPASETLNGQNPASPREGFPAPDFTLELLGGGQISLAELHGKPVILNFWASWCPPCRAEMPAMEKVYQAYKDEGVVVIGLNTTYQDSEADAADFVEEIGISFSITLDRDGSVSRHYLVNGLPTTFFIDRQGIIRSVIVGGPMSESLIRTKIESLIRDTP